MDRSQVLAAPGRLDPTAAEERQLSSFLDGAIMDVGVRHHLWRSWGLCPRHSWQYALLELERLSGRPLSTAILYLDLVRRAGHRMRRARLLPTEARRRLLLPGADCFTCEFVRIARGEAEATGDRPQAWPAATRTLRQGARIWRAWGCPDCGAGEGVRCRPHLLASGTLDAEAAVAFLQDLGAEMTALVRSFSWNADPPTPRQRVAWVGAVGWFSGWAPVLAISEGAPA